jgi:hypothetical protein
MVNCRDGKKFHEAATVFADPLAVTYHHPDHSPWNVEKRPRLDCGPFRPRREYQDYHSRVCRIRRCARKTTLRERKYYEEEN